MSRDYGQTGPFQVKDREVVYLPPPSQYSSTNINKIVWAWAGTSTLLLIASFAYFANAFLGTSREFSDRMISVETKLNTLIDQRPITRDEYNADKARLEALIRSIQDRP